MSGGLAERLTQDAYDGYAYAYPHKLAYRPLNPPVSLREAWRSEDRSRLFLYVHLPFCEMRCGFCNLFTTSRPEHDFVQSTLRNLERQSEIVAAEVRPERIAQVAFGGGTPTYLSTPDIVRLFERLARSWPVDWQAVPVSFESSPGTVDPEKLAALRELGVDRLSMGVQSFAPAVLKSLGRPQPAGQLAQACGQIRDAGFDVFNLDLIYGSVGQSEERWLQTLRDAVSWRPDELYLYPLYVRALTGLGRKQASAGENRRALYRLGRDFLLDAGYTQCSMRQFRRSGAPPLTAEYTCQRDGMIGLGAGARSYTSALHYSSEYAVGKRDTQRIVEQFNARSDEAHREVDYGVRLDLAEQKRRWVIQSLLQGRGMDTAAYRARFGTKPAMDVPQLAELLELGLAHRERDVLRLTPAGLERSDTIGPWLYSDDVQRQIETSARS